MFRNIAWVNVLRVIQLGITILLIQYLAFWLNIDNCSTAIMSAIVVSQSFVGGLYLKVSNRLAGTGLGLGFGLVMICLFPGAPEYYLLFTLLWFMFTTTLASLVNSERAYLYQLAGYTFAFVGFSMLETPDDAWHTLLYRGTNVLFGLLVMVISSTILFPRYGAAGVNYRIGKLYRSTLKFRRAFERRERVTGGDIQYFFERLSLIIRQRTYIKSEAHLNTQQARQLDRFLESGLLALFYANILRFIDTGDSALIASLTQGFHHPLHALGEFRRHRLNHRAPSRRGSTPFSEQVFIMDALKRGVRTLTGTLLMLLIWYHTGWQGGSTMLTLGVVYIILCSTAANPMLVASEALNGTIQGVIGGFIYEQWIISSVSVNVISWLYFVVQIPLIIYGGAMLTRGDRVMRGITLLTTFYFVVPPENVTQFIYSRFINDAMGAVAGVLGAGLTLCLIFPERSRVSVKGLVRATLSELNFSLERGGGVAAKRVMVFHDRLVKAVTGARAENERSFTLLMDLASLNLLCLHVRHYPEAAAGLAPIADQVKKMLRIGRLRFTGREHIQYQYALARLKVDSPESYGVALCGYHILTEVQRQVGSARRGRLFNQVAYETCEKLF